MAKFGRGIRVAGFAIAALGTGVVAAQDEEERVVPAGEVQILAPGTFETLPPLPFPETDPALARPENDEEPAYRDIRYRRLSTPEFRTFESDGDFRRYMSSVERLKRENRRRRYGVAEGDAIVIAMLQDEVPECAVPEDCPEAPTDQTVVVTGSRIASSPASMPVAVTTTDGVNITNTQVAAVDEGDIVKLIGEYLLVLQDGRVFAVHYPTMKLTDRTDVYRRDEDGDPIGADWYDEMLVQGDQVIITAYSYEDDASEITVLRLDQESGKVEPRGVFLISSDDYYDVDNYATRIVGDRLVIYTPYEAEELVSRRKRPVIRRWTNAEDFYENEDRGGHEVLDIRNVYRPVFGVSDPWVHTVSICPLGEVIERGLRCESTGFVGGDAAEMYVTSDAAYLWNWALSWEEVNWRDCEPGTPPPEFGEVAPAAIYRIPIGRGEVEVLGARGMPIDQFGMDATERRFRALASMRRHACDDYSNPHQFALLDAPLVAFRDRYVAARESELTYLPPLIERSAENRFVGDWVVYGGRDRYSRRPPRDAEGSQRARATVLNAVPIERPGDVQRISLGHTLIRLERMGNGAVIANGYADESGLRSSYVTLEAAADASGVRSSAFLPGRYESEGRSHAFNATITGDGSGMMGLPTVTRTEHSGGWWWYSDVSDLSFLGFTSEGLLSDGGTIIATPEDEVETGEGYECEISCIDWYGNARPIFLGGKVYGLMATELVEADVVEGKVAERRRVDLTGPVGR